LALGNTVVDDDLLDQVGTQIEAKVNLYLQKAYTLPLSLPQPVVSEIVEKLVICELFDTLTLGGEGKEGDAYCDDAMGLLLSITNGELVLNTEQETEPNTIAQNVTVVQRRTGTATDQAAAFTQEKQYTAGSVVTGIDPETVRW
jgi:phage gp36-like protein